MSHIDKTEIARLWDGEVVYGECEEIEKYCEERDTCIFIIITYRLLFVGRI